MAVVARLFLRDVFLLPYKGEGLFRSRSSACELQSIFVRRKRQEIIVTIRFVRRSILGMAPDPIFQHFIPNISAAGLCRRRISADYSTNYSGRLRIASASISGKPMLSTIPSTSATEQHILNDHSQVLAGKDPIVRSEPAIHRSLQHSVLTGLTSA
jgi:hypothetical protein